MGTKIESQSAAIRAVEPLSLKTAICRPLFEAPCTPNNRFRSAREIPSEKG